MKLRDRNWFLAFILCICICNTLFDRVDASEYDLIQLGLEACNSIDFCSGNMSLTTKLAYTCCYECSCDKSCITARNCCPGTNTLDESKYKMYLTNESSSARNRGSFIQDSTYMYLSSKPNYSVVSKCPNMTSCRMPFPGASSSVLLRDYTLVNERDTGVIFLNRACARCHGITDVVEWGLFLDVCSGPRWSDIRFGYLPQLRQELLDYIYNWCRLFMVPPLKYQTVTRRFSSSFITSCNVTGEWDVFSAHLEKACHDGTYEIYSNAIVEQYKNPYCMYCNKAKGFRPDLECSDVTHTIDKSNIFSGLLRLRTTPKDTSIDMEWLCGEEEIYDTLRKRCLIVHCQQLMMPLYGKCKALPFVYVGYLYHFSLKFIPERDTSVVSDDIEAIPNAAQTLTYDLLESVGLSYNCIFNAFMFLYRDPDTRHVVFYTMTEIEGSGIGCSYLDAFRAIQIIDQGYIEVKISLNGEIFPYRAEYYDNVVYEKYEQSTVEVYDSLSAGVKDFGYGSIKRVEFDDRNPEYPIYLAVPTFFFTRPYTCPYLKFNTSELCDLSFVSQPLNDSDPCYVSDNTYKPYFHVTTEYVGDNSLDIHYRICVEDYLNIIQKSIGSPLTPISILSLTLSSVARMCAFLLLFI